MNTQSDPDMLEEYGFSNGVRGKYAKQYSGGTNVVVLEADIAEVFPDSESVNEALRAGARLLVVARKTLPRSKRPARVDGADASSFESAGWPTLTR